MLINIFFLQLISFASANPALNAKEAIDASNAIVDIVVKLSKELKSQADEVRDQIRDERDKLRDTAKLDINAFTEQVARASSRLESAVLSGNFILKSMLMTTDKQVIQLESTFQGVRYHSAIIKSSKKNMLTALERGLRELSELLQQIQVIKDDMAAIANEAQNLHDQVQAEWTDERVNNRARDWRFTYLAGVKFPALLPAAIIFIEVNIADWKRELQLSKEAVDSIKGKFQSLKDGADELKNHALKAETKYKDALMVMGHTNDTVRSQGCTEEDADKPSADEIAYGWGEQVIPALKELRQKLIDLLE